MSIELPEVKILAEQMNKELVRKRVRSYSLKDYETATNKLHQQRLEDL